MKLHFEPDLDYQDAAIKSVCDLFRGQEICRTEFTVTRDTADQQQRMTFAENDLGIGNRLTLLDDELLANLHAIQLRHSLARLFHDVRQEGAARALISEGNSHFRWGGMPTTVCRNQL